MNKRVSIKDIAMRVGVSTALVSYVLNGKEKEARVGADMVKKIRKVAKALNYQPNLIARSLKSGKTKTLGLIVADISNPFFSTLARIIENEAAKNGYTVIFGSSDEKIEKSKKLIDTLLNHQVAGLIITPVEGSESQIKELREKNIPFILIDRALSQMDTNAVVINNEEISKQAVELLVSNGYSKIGMIAYDNTLTNMQERMNGYKKALKNKKIKFNPNLLKKVAFENITYDVNTILNTWLKNDDQQVDAIFMATNTISLEVLRVLQKLKIKVPEDIGLVCFDESDAYSFYYTPVTYVEQDMQLIGENAVNNLFKMIENHEWNNQITIVPAKLIIRESSTKL